MSQNVIVVWVCLLECNIIEYFDGYDTSSHRNKALRNLIMVVALDKNADSYQNHGILQKFC